MKRIHCLTHVPFENAANIGLWTKENGHQLRYTHLYKNQPFPVIHEFDILVIMGGPMNIYEEQAYPWLKKEKSFIKRAIDANKKVIGVCLGAQFIADVLGAKVTQNKYKEIGWFDVALTNQAMKSQLFSQFPKTFTAFHWHGDTFDNPAGAVHLATSGACGNQAFQYGSNVIALQFHIDYSKQSIEKMLKNCSEEITDAPFIQQPDEIRNGYNTIPKIKGLLYKLLDSFCR